MPEPFSLGLVSLAAIYTLSRPGSGVSDDANSIRRSASAIVRSVEQSVALFGDKAVVITQIQQIAIECSRPGWDGDNAEPISASAVDLAINFIRALPSALPLPEIAPEPDGEISLDWLQGRTRLFSLSMGLDDRLPYAWLDGTDKGHGVVRFDGSTITSRILNEIRTFTDCENAPLRAA